MSSRSLETDYLVVGAGAAGMSFVDTLIDHTAADVVMVDRRAAPGGHWNDAYPFVRLHQPSLYYGVASTPLGDGALQDSGPEAGMYDRASGAELRAYYERVMQRRLLASGRVRFFPQSDYQGDHRGDHRFVSRLSGESFDVKVRRALVDATYLAPAIPADTPPPFEIGAGASLITVNQLAALDAAPDRFVIIGAGKTALDACVWLLEGGVDPARIRWVKPREAWLRNRGYTQPGALIGRLFDGIATQMQAAAEATSLDDLFARLEATEQLRRVDPSVNPTMFRSAIIGDWEIDLLRRIGDVVRLGRVRRIDRDRVVLEHGHVPGGSGDLYVHCAGDGLRRPPALPIFAAGRITLQPVRVGLVPFNAALVAFVEAHRDNDAEKNRLCPPNPYPDTPLDWARGLLIQMRADRAWSQQADIAAWLEELRLNPMRGLAARRGDPDVRRAAERFTAHVKGAIDRMTALVAGERS